MKIMILICFLLYLYRILIDIYITGTIGWLRYSALIRYILCQLAGIHGKDIRENAQPIFTRR